MSVSITNRLSSLISPKRCHCLSYRQSPPISLTDRPFSVFHGQSVSVSLFFQAECFCLADKAPFFTGRLSLFVSQIDRYLSHRLSLSLSLILCLLLSLPLSAKLSRTLALNVSDSYFSQTVCLHHFHGKAVSISLKLRSPLSFSGSESLHLSQKHIILASYTVSVTYEIILSLFLCDIKSVSFSLTDS